MLLRFGIFAALLGACGGGQSFGAAMAGPHFGGGPEYQPRTRENVADAPRYEDCNDNAVDGRETNVKSSDSHCGRCGNGCEGSCNRGVCTVQRPETAE